MEYGGICAYTPRMRFLFSVLMTVVLAVPVHALTPDEELRREIDTFVPVLAQDKADIAAEGAEAGIEASAEFFPSDGTEVPGEREDPNATTVVVRINDIPYALKDVPLTAWFAPYVRDMAERGIVSGYKDAQGIPTGVFGPERNVTLAELAKMAVAAAQIETSSCPAEPKNPTAKGLWSAPYVACAEQKNFAVFGDGTADTKRAATRAEVVITVLQAFGASVDELTEADNLFKDVTPSTLFAGAIKTAVLDGVVNGYADAGGKPTGFFGPDKFINRAEVSKILSIAVQVYGQ